MTHGSKSDIMPVKTKRDEEKWQRAKEIAAEQGQKDNYAYIMGIYKKMKPDYKFKTAAERLIQAYEEGFHAPWGYEPGKVTPQSAYHNEGSQMPPARDRDGKPIAIREYPRLDIPGYTYHDTSKEFHSNPPGDAAVPRVKNASETNLDDLLEEFELQVVRSNPLVVKNDLIKVIVKDNGDLTCTINVNGISTTTTHKNIITRCTKAS